MRVIAAEKIDTHLVQVQIEFFILLEQVFVYPHAHLFTTSVTDFDNLFSQFDRWNIYAIAPCWVDVRVR